MSFFARRFFAVAGRFGAGVAALVGLVGLTSCTATHPERALMVSVADQKMALYEKGALVRVYGVSTSKFGVGDQHRSNCTPVGKMKVAKKIGQGVPPGMVFKSRQPTGEVLRPNAPGRDPIVTRILWLQGTESQTRNAFGRFIYIHGTPEEVNIGRPASFGCIRMRSMDVIDLFNHVPVGLPVVIEKGHLPGSARHQAEYAYVAPAPVVPLKQFSPARPAAGPATAVASARRKR